MSRYRGVGRALQVSWLGLAILALALFARSVAPRYRQLLQAASRYERVLQDLALSPDAYAAYLTVLDVVLILAHVAIASVIFWRARDSTMAVFVALVLVVAPLAAIDALGAGVDLQGWTAGAIRYLGLATSVGLLYLFPDGRFIPPWTRALALLWALLNLPAVFFPGSPLSFTSWPQPLPALILLGWPATGVVVQLYRYLRVSGAQQRRQTRWAILGLAAAALGPIGHYTAFLSLPSLSHAGTPTILYNLADPTLFRFAFLSQLAGVTAYTLGLLLFPLSLAVAVLRERLFDIEIVVNRTLVYTGLTALVAGLYVLVVGALGRLLQAQGNVALAILATGLIAVLFNPLRQRLQRAVNRLMYGERDDPAAVLERLGARMEQAAAPEAMLPVLVEAVAQALRLPYVALTLGAYGDGRGEEIVAAYGEPGSQPARFALVYQGQPVGRLLVAPRAPGELFIPGELRLLENIARQASAAVYAYRLTEQLRRSRERLVTAREEERRRLRRDLHDGLGPRLAVMALKVEAARNCLDESPQAADANLAALKGEIQEALQDVRRLAYALRPPALDQLGLAHALSERAAQHSANGLLIHVETPEPLPPLPAAVEVAAYRIALEAINNAALHANATRCTVRLAMRDGLHLSIHDNGVGLPAAKSAGVGLASMRERAEELGGTFRLQSAPGSGTEVSVQLPVSRRAT